MGDGEKESQCLQGSLRRGAEKEWELYDDRLGERDFLKC